MERIKECKGANVYIMYKKENEKELKQLFDTEQTNMALIVKARLPKAEVIIEQLK